jgi:eukaryotic translation initiation factor 2C
VKNGDRRIRDLQHLQNVVASNIFNLRIVYDGRALAYSPSRALSLAGGTGETVSLLFYLAEYYAQSYLCLSQFSISSIYSNVQVPPDSKGSVQIRFTQTSASEVF